MTKHRSGPPLTGSHDGRVSVEVRLHGHLDAHWTSWLDGLSLTHGSDGTTTLRGTVADQAQLHGLLARIRDLGVTLISLTSADDETAGSNLPCDRSADPDHDARHGPDPPGSARTDPEPPAPERKRP